MLKRFLVFVVALLICAWIHVVLIQLNVSSTLLVTWGEADRLLQPGEIQQYLLLLVLGTPAAVLFALMWSEQAFGRVTNVLGRASYWLPAASATVAAFCISRYVTHGAWFTDDEQAYLFQMHGYLKGMLTMPALNEEPLFHHGFVVVSQIKGGVPRWAGIYPVMQPAMMALSSLLGSPLISQWLCAGAIAYNSGKLAETLAGDRQLGLCAAWLCAASPMLVGLAATYHTSVLSCLLSILSLRACLHVRSAPSFVGGALVGLCAGATFLTRELEGTLMVVITAGALLWWHRKALARSVPMFAGLALMNAVAFGVYLWVNLNTTGDMFDTAYAAWSRGAGRIMGFGTGMIFGRTHTMALGMSQTFTTVVRMNAWIFGWPTSLLLPLLGLVRPLRSTAVVWLLLLSAVQLGGYFFLAFGSVHDFGAAYHVWHVPWLAAATVAVMQRMRIYTAHVPRVLFGMMLVGWLTFWPTQIEKWNVTARSTFAPVRAAELTARGRRAIVLWTTVNTPGIVTWVHIAPAPDPDAQLLWAHDVPMAQELLAREFPDRVLLRLIWDGNVPRVVEVTKPI
jgi:hypothetical protein